MKIVRNGTVDECFTELEDQVPYFLQHTYIKRNQAEFFKIQKSDVQENNSKIVIQVDFAENYTTKYQNEIQSSYWSYNQITLFTACAWAGKQVHSMVIVSDYMAHDKYAVITFLKLILKHLETEREQYDEIFFFSDGVSSQFKQQYLLCALTHFQRNITWQYFATSHGKGAVDGIGGEVKRIVTTSVLAKEEQVQNSIDFYHVAKKKCQKIQILYCGTDEIQGRMQELDKLWKNILPIPSVRGIHFAKVIAENALEIKKIPTSITSLHHYFKNESTCKPTSCPINSGQWVLVQYSKPGNSSTKTADSTVHHFIGQVLLSQSSELQVKFLKKTGNTFIWPSQDDLDFIKTQDVVMVLSEPQMDRRGHLSFENDDFVTKFNVK